MKRKISEKLKQWKLSKDRKPLILKGARQVGKTYALKAFGETEFPAYHYVNFEKNTKIGALFEEDRDPVRIVRELSFYFDRSIDIHKDLLIFDEIQACPQALTSLKYFCEEMPSLAVCAAGSLLGVQLSTESFPVGKVNWLTLYPLSFGEFLTGIGEERLSDFLSTITRATVIPIAAHERLWEQLKCYFIVGGLPEAVVCYQQHQENLYEAFQKVRERQEDLIKTYYADIAKHAGKINAMHIDRVWRAVPAQLARAQEGSSKFGFKDIIPGVDRYSRLINVIDWLVHAGVIIKVPIVNCAALPLSAYTKENIFKLFMFDVGLLGAMSDLPPKTILAYDYGTYKGYFAENFVAQALIASGSECLYSWSEGTSEVEFLREINGQIIPIEVKSGSVTHAKSLAIFAKKYHSLYRVVFSAKPLHVDNAHGVHYYPLYLAALGSLKENW